MNIEHFISLLDIDFPEVEKAIHYCKLKGVQKHHSIYLYLLSMKGGKVTYAEVATAYRYDKRIRKVLYKYIGLFEEYLRAYLSNKYHDNFSNLKLIKPVSKKLDKGMNFTDALEDILFGDLVSQILLLEQSEMSEVFNELVLNEQNFKAIIELRNAVSHNRFLLNYLKFKECTIDGYKHASLYANLLNFSAHLPTEIRESFIKEVNECQIYINEKKNSNFYQVAWDLIKDIIVVIEPRKEKIFIRK